MTFPNQPVAGYYPYTSPGAAGAMEATAAKVVDDVLTKREALLTKFVKVYRLRPSNSATPSGTYLETINYDDIGNVERLISNRYGGGLFRAECWVDGKKKEGWEFTLAGQAKSADGTDIIEDPRAAVIHQNGYSQPLGSATSYTPLQQGTEAFERELAHKEALSAFRRECDAKDQTIRALKGDLERLRDEGDAERRKQRRDLDTQLDNLRDDHRRKLDGLADDTRRSTAGIREERDRLTVRVEALQNELRRVETTQRSSSEVELLKTMLAAKGDGGDLTKVLLEAALRKTEGGDGEERLLKTIELVDAIRGGGKEEPEEGVRGWVKDILGGLRDARGLIPGGMAEHMAPPIPEVAQPQPGLPAPVNMPPAPANIAPGMLATERFTAILQEGVQYEPDARSWAEAAVKELTTEARNTMARVNSEADLVGLLERVPGLDVQKLGAYLEEPANAGKKRWLNSALAALKLRCGGA